MSVYVLTPRANADIFDIWSHIADDNQDAADSIERAIYDACAFVAEAPMLHPTTDDTRTALKFAASGRQKGAPGDFPVFRIIIRLENASGQLQNFPVRNQRGRFSSACRSNQAEL